MPPTRALKETSGGVVAAAAAATTTTEPVTATPVVSCAKCWVK